MISLNPLKRNIIKLKMRNETAYKLCFGFAFGMIMMSSVAFAQGFQDVVGTLKDIGVFEFYLPFLLVFAIIYGLLNKIQIFGDKAKGINVIVALAIAGFTMVATPVGITLSQFLANFASQWIVVILTIVAIVVFVSLLTSGGLFKKETLEGFFQKGNLTIALILLALLAVGVFISSGGTSIFPGLKISTRGLFGPVGGINTNTLALIALIVGTGVIIFLFTRSGEEKPAK